MNESVSKELAISRRKALVVKQVNIQSYLLGWLRPCLTLNGLKKSTPVKFTLGKAREAIENCVLLDPDTGYSRARIILQDQFGQNYIVARAHLEEVITRSPLRVTDSQGLWDLARDMRRCQMTTSQMGYSADMSTTDTLLKIQHLLPVHIQSKWANRAHSLMEQSVMPNFSHLTDFIEESV
ncbi:uncharacterized protein LOC135154607 [Lytechinus pictus]|uniref:uncharacterized protein LOC135154607 n=1 Tax=Lytechinus pictus TaxID=7653 RepID=UPI0030B9C240